jgi:3-oxoadipate enol-lactonase
MPHVDLADVRIHYEIEGDQDRPALVLSHSIGANLKMWDAVLADLSRRFRVLRYDTRGHGASSVPAGPCTIADLGNDVLALLDALEIRRCVFCGLSLGGMTGTWLGVHARDRIDKLILANTAARIGTREGWDARIAFVRQAGMASIADSIIARWFTQEFRERSPAIVADSRRVLIETPVEGYAGCCAAIRDADFTEELPGIETPPLVIAGALDPATTPGDGRTLAYNIRGATYVELETAHLSALEDPHGFSRSVLEFLSGQEA